MTSNQIALRNVKNEEAKLAEERRHNLATEGYTQEHYQKQDAASLMQAEAATSQASTAEKQLAINQINAETQRYVAETGRLSYQESSRHNRVNEDIQWGQLTESQRHNLTSEAQQWASISENARHNLANENISIANLRESERHNKMSESISWSNLQETNRHNIQAEKVSYLQADIAAQQADIAKYNAETKRAELVQKTADDAIKNLIAKQKNAIQDAYNEGRLDIEKQKLNKMGKPEINVNIDDRDSYTYDMPRSAEEPTANSFWDDLVDSFHDFTDTVNDNWPKWLPSQWFK